jgi:hypothetical protein
VILPLPLPNLDDRTWKDLVEEGRSLIPKWSPQWTNYNPSDPGITLVELFAYLSEILMFRLNLVSNANVIAFLRLINGQSGAWKPSGDLKAAARDVLLAHNMLGRAVTTRDFEELALGFDGAVDSSERVARASCVPGRNLRREWEGGAAGDSSADVTLVVVSPAGGDPSASLLHQIANALEPYRLLTTRLHVSGPRYVGIGVHLTLKVRSRSLADAIRERAVQALREFFDPLRGGADGRGWPFGRDVYVSELYQLLSDLDGVVQVTPTIEPAIGRSLAELHVAPPDSKRLIRNRLDEVEAIDLGPGELVRAQIEPADLVVEAPKG